MTRLRKARADRLGRLGLSAAKIKTLKNLAREIAAERLNLDVLANEDADAAHNTLTALHGIGPWTADVYLLFCLGHGDAWPAGDLAVQEAVKIGLGLKTRPTAKQMAPLAEPWRPLRGAAAHLWWSYYRVLKKREGVIGKDRDRSLRRSLTRSSRAQAVTKPITARTAGRSTGGMRQQPEIRHAGELLRRDPDQIGIGLGDQTGQRGNPEPGPGGGEHVALRRAAHHNGAVPRDQIAPARKMRVRIPVGKANHAVALPFVAPLRQPLPRRVVARGAIR